MPGNTTDSYQLFSDVSKSNVEWLWYPYIPCGKITVLQGDPGCGKSTVMMDFIGRLTSGSLLLDGRLMAPMNVLYQCSEDGLADTVKPRLERMNADCTRVGYINEDLFGLTLDDEKIRTAMIDMDARLLVIDPFQAYIGDADLSNASGMRRILRRLNMWASANNCAVVLVGHLNKKSGSKELYRGLGSIDVVAAARSVIQVDRDEENDELRVVKHIKSSLAPKAKDLYFKIESNGRLGWIENRYSMESEPVEIIDEEIKRSKQELAVDYMKSILANGPVEATVVEQQLIECGISQRTIKTAKKTIGVVSRRIENKWFWNLPTANGKYPILQESDT